MAKLFLAKGADINGADEEHSSFLAYAILVDNVELDGSRRIICVEASTSNASEVLRGVPSAR
ncbi:MAG: hypothetical protein AAGF87_06360 [Bacteroidota bacterium]